MNSRFAFGCAALLTLTSIPMTGCDPKPDVKPAMETGQVSGPRPGVYLRASFDGDPSRFMGRFISNNVKPVDIDENQGVKTSCSKFVKWTEIPASGEYDEYYRTSTSVKGNLGVKAAPSAAEKVMSVAGQKAPSGDLSVGNESGTSIRVKYTITKKMVSEIEDIDGFKACCEKDADNCSQQFLGEFLQGTGELFVKQGRQTDVGASGSAATAKGGVTVKDGWSWRRSTKFDNAYFAFRVMKAQLTDTCAWADKPPKSDKGQYFVGISAPVKTEDMAQDKAMDHARAQVVRWLGTSVASASVSTADAFKGYLKDERIVANAAKGMVSYVTRERSCKAERVKSQFGEMWKTKVLVHFPHEKRKEAAVKVLEAAEKEGKLSSEDKAKIVKELK